MTIRGKKYLFTLPLFYAGLIFHAFSCRPATPSVTRQNFSQQYRPEERILRPRFAVYNVTDSMARLYFTINSKDLLYTKGGGEGRYMARILLSYTLHPVDFPKVIVDSGRVVMNDVDLQETKKQLASSVDMDVIIPGKYFVEVTFRDLNKASIAYALVHLDHRAGDVGHNFLATHKGTDIPLFQTYLDSGQAFNIHFYKSSVTKIHVRYFQNRSGPAAPPYAPEKPPAQPLVPDSAWTLDISANPDVVLPEEGWYLFTTDPASPRGFCLARFYRNFPEITVASQLLFPLRYMTMKTEYIAMDTAANVKRTVDQFWLKNTGSEERARELIRNFYNRVGAANTLFSTEKEGWKTDRGMIYLIFGPPGNVYRRATTETWIYSNDIGGGGITFIFDHNDKAPTDQEYVLERSMTYDGNWIHAVDAWRQGHVYTLR